MLIDYVLCSSQGQVGMSDDSTVEDLYRIVLNLDFYGDFRQHSQTSAFYVICNGRRLEQNCILELGKTYHLVPRVLGGKGGFGSMLRAIGAQIEKTTSREACRDLSGRRMRDINNEKKLKDWLAKEAEREQERDERRKDRLEKHLRSQHKFDDTEYHEQKAKVQEDLQEALSTGLKRKMKNGEGSATTFHKIPKGEKKTSKTEWLGVDLDSDSESSDSDMEANPGEPGVSTSQEKINSDKHDRLSGSSSEGHVGDTDLMGSCTGGAGSGEKISNSPSTTSHNPNHLLESRIKVEKTDQTVENTIKSEAAPQGDNSKEPEVDIPSDTPVDLEKISSGLELQALGLDRLKHALISRGLKCGGTLEERVDRLIVVKGLSAEEIQASHPGLLAKGPGKGGKGKKSKS